MGKLRDVWYRVTYDCSARRSVAALVGKVGVAPGLCVVVGFGTLCGTSYWVVLGYGALCGPKFLCSARHSVAALVESWARWGRLRGFVLYWGLP